MQLTREMFVQRFGTRPLFGMVHLAPLPGSPFATSMSDVLELALGDAAAIERGGAAAIMIENFGDRPFFKRSVPVETVAAMTRVITEIKLKTKLPIGVNVLRNDGEAALAIATAVGAALIRVNVLTGAMLTDQGIIESDAASLLRKRAALGGDIAIFADHMVKHATPLGAVDEEQSAKDLRLRAGADAIVVSGKETGGAVDTARIELLRRATDAPIVIGSGLTAANAALYRDLVDGAIVGTSIKTAGLDSPVDEAKMRALVKAFG
jgi:uncharacterized protein